MALPMQKGSLGLLLSLFILFLALIYPPPSSTEFDSFLEPSSPRTALILTAHPDDEAMFFSPTILSLVASGWDVRALCMSLGNSSGLGEVRRQELYASYDVLGVEGHNVMVLDDPDLQDSMTLKWDPKLIASALNAYLERRPVSLMITFDHTGISGHPNHIALAASLPHLPSTLSKSFMLRSPSLYRKFTGPLDLIIHLFSRSMDSVLLRPLRHSHELDKSGVTVFSSLYGWWTGVRAMLQHRSQLVWFRWLYLGFSSLMWINELDEIGG